MLLCILLFFCRSVPVHLLCLVVVQPFLCSCFCFSRIILCFVLSCLLSSFLRSCAFGFFNLFFLVMSLVSIHDFTSHSPAVFLYVAHLVCLLFVFHRILLLCLVLRFPLRASLCTDFSQSCYRYYSLVFSLFQFLHSGPCFTALYVSSYHPHLSSSLLDNGTVMK